MFNEAFWFLALLFLIGLVARNNSLMFAVGVLLILKLTFTGDMLFPYLKRNGINWGVTVLTIAVLAPIATGDIGFRHLLDAVRSINAWAAVLAGIFVSLIARDGVRLLNTDPTITTALVLGTVLSVAVFKGVPVGPLIGAGIAYWLMQLINVFK
ncbi:MAG: DUF441 domain-containing protein [Turicibacter sp.]|nr:DUF441 domain-containing protein [Turicibacter sp.]